MNKNIEIRSFDVEFRNDPEGRHIEGYGSVFNKRSLDLGGFTEIIATGAFDGVIENSDVKAYLDHNPERGMLARSRKGKGSMTLSIDEDGLKYSFDAPKTALGDEVVEGLKRGDYSQSSFAFTVAEEVWSTEEDGSYLRTITKINRLYDVSIVADPAYPDTSVAVRSLEAFKASQGGLFQENPVLAEEAPVQERDVEETPDNGDSDVPVEEVRSEEPVVVESSEEPVAEPTEETPAEEQENTPEVQEEQTPEPKDERNNIKNNKNMKNFSLIKTINDVISNRNINEDALSVIELGAQEMRKSGLSYSGQIQLPVEERADAPTEGAIVATVATQGQEIVPTDKLNILEPLRGESILSKVGATFLTGLVGNISIPAYSGSTAAWKGEMVDAEDGKGAFSTVELAPKRLTAYIDISKQFLVQDSVGAEEMLRRDIVNAIIAKLEQTVFGDEAGSNDKPAGLLYNAEEGNPSYAEACDDEASITDFRGEKLYVMSPSAKSAFKQTTISGSKSDLRLLMQDNEVNGYRVVSSSNVADGGYLYGDFSELVVAQWGSIDIVVDPYTLATKNAVRLVVNCFFDAKLRRSGAVLGHIIDGSEA